MEEPTQNQQIAAIEKQISELAQQLAEARDVVKQWTDANANLSLNAAEARAKNQGMGRGFISGLLGSKFRSAMRTAATTSNAAIAKQVAEKRAKVVAGKREAQELVKQLQDQLKLAKQELKELAASNRQRWRVKSVTARASHDSLAVLQKLKEAYDAGLLTDAEYEEKRTKLVSEL